MIEDATGRQSGSVYEGRIMPRGDEGVVIKSDRLDAIKYSGAVHILRHPLDAITSYFHYFIGEVEWGAESFTPKQVDIVAGIIGSLLNRSCYSFESYYEQK